MANDYFTFINPFVPNTRVQATPVNTQFQGLETAFDLLPSPSSITTGQNDVGIESGTGNAYVVTMTPVRSSNGEGDRVTFKATHGNTGGITIAVDGVGAVTALKHDGTVFTGSELVITRYYTFRFNAVTSQFFLEATLDAILQVGYATEWATKIEDSLISTAAGGDGLVDFSALHHAAKAAASAASIGAENLFLAGTHDASTGAPANPVSRAVYRITGAGTFDSIDWLVDDEAYYDGANWRQLGGIGTVELTGDVTGSGVGTFAATIQPDTVTMDKIVDIATDTFLGRVTASTGTVEVLTNAQAKTALDLAGTNSGDQSSIVGITGTGAQFDTAVTDENFAFAGKAFHDGFSDFVAQEHIRWDLTGGENLFSDRSANSVLALTSGEVGQLANIGTTSISLADWQAVAAMSGVNSGDQTSIVGITGTGAQFDISVTDENFAFAGKAFHDGFSDFVAQEHLRWDLDLGGTNLHANNSANGVLALTSGEVIQLANIGATTISATEWIALSALIGTNTGDQSAASIEAIVSHDNLVDFVSQEHIRWDLTGAENLFTDRSANSVLALTSAEVTQLANIGGTSISLADWQAVAAMSGVNSGDQTSIVGITGTGVQFNTAVTDENLAFVGGAFHDGFSDFVAEEHLRWDLDLGGTNLHANNSANGVLALASGEVTQLANIGGTSISLTDWQAVAAMSGVNSGDQTSIVGITGTRAQFDTAVTDGNFAYAGLGYHDGFSDFVAQEHIRWDLTGAENVHADRYTNTIYTHPAYSTRSINTSGASVLDIFTSDAIGAVTNITTRTLTLANLGYTGSPTANDYTHPGHPGDDFSLDTGALSGATVISDIDINVTTDTQGHVTDANGTVVTRNLTAANIGAVSLTIAETIAGLKTFSTRPKFTGQGVMLNHASELSGTVTLSTGAPTGGSDGDIWFQY